MTRRTSKELLRPFVALLLGFAIIPVMVAPSFAKDDYKKLKERPYEGSRDREYIVHLPPSYDPAVGPLPLVMVLHGGGQKHETIKHDTNFDSVADQERFIVVYPFITSWEGQRPEDAWGWWMDAHIHAGRGEVQDLAEIIKEVQHDYRVDPNRIHIAGVSAGGAMAVAALVAHSKLFASGSQTGGLPYSETPDAVSVTCEKPGTFKSIDEIAKAMSTEMGDEKRPVPVFIIHSTADCVVKVQAAENIRDAWGKAFGVDTTNPIASCSGVTKGTKWTHKKYGDPNGNTVVETLFVECLKHGWYGGRDGEYAFSNAPNTAQLAWDFFQSHPLHPCPCPTPPPPK